MKIKLRIFIILSIILILCLIIFSFVYIDKCKNIEENIKKNVEDILIQQTLSQDSLSKEIDIIETPKETIEETIETEFENEPYIEEIIIDKKIIIDKELHDFNVYHVAKVVWGEARGCTKLEQSAVVWCILNRVDAGYGTIYEVITAPHQFAYFDIEPFQDIYDIVDDVLNRWYREQAGEIDVGRTLPKEYKYFWGDNLHNYFRINITDQVYWDWSLPNPYEN